MVSEPFSLSIVAWMGLSRSSVQSSRMMDVDRGGLFWSIASYEMWVPYRYKNVCIELGFPTSITNFWDVILSRLYHVITYVGVSVVWIERLFIKLIPYQFLIILFHVNKIRRFKTVLSYWLLFSTVRLIFDSFFFKICKLGHTTMYTCVKIL